LHEAHIRNAPLLFYRKRFLTFSQLFACDFFFKHLASCQSRKRHSTFSKNYSHGNVLYQTIRPPTPSPCTLPVFLKKYIYFFFFAWSTNAAWGTTKRKVWRWLLFIT
jgi:hypothetical protein